MMTTDNLHSTERDHTMSQSNAEEFAQAVGPQFGPNRIEREIFAGLAQLTGDRPGQSGQDIEPIGDESAETLVRRMREYQDAHYPERN